jgi:hypothetical protein
MLISLLTGFAAGALHVVGGADHLVAMAPMSLNRPVQALRSGLAWGVGHAAGVVVLALMTLLIKDLAHLEAMSAWAEWFVGVSLLVVGTLAIRTAFGLELHTHEHHHDGERQHATSTCTFAVRAITGAMPMPLPAWGSCMAWPVPAMYWL